MHPALDVDKEKYLRQRKFLSTAPSSEVASYLRSTPVVAAQLQMRLATHRHVSIREALAARKDLLPSAQRILAEDENSWVRTFLFGNAAVSNELRLRILQGPLLRFQFVSRGLKTSEDPAILRAAYRHAVEHRDASPAGASGLAFNLAPQPNLPRDVLDELLGRVGEDVYLGVRLAQRVDLTPDDMRNLLESDRSYGSVLAENPATPVDILRDVPAILISVERLEELGFDSDLRGLASNWKGTLRELEEALDLTRR